MSLCSRLIDLCVLFVLDSFFSSAFLHRDTATFLAVVGVQVQGIIIVTLINLLSPLLFLMIGLNIKKITLGKQKNDIPHKFACPNESWVKFILN